MAFSQFLYSVEVSFILCGGKFYTLWGYEISVKKSITSLFQGSKLYFFKSKFVTVWGYALYSFKGIDNTFKMVYNGNKQLFIGTYYVF